MSTFNGVVPEFPDIRIDHFRQSLNPVSRPALAYFLSHVHTDHLVGLESCKSPFIYCSPATRDILLRLEKYPHRMNFVRGVLETRKQTYRHLKRLLKAIPLDTPTAIELAPGRSLRVTLVDANHCVGAVMFLIQGDDGTTVLYTGDVRSERWWVDSLMRHPVLLPYIAGQGSRTLAAIYLDTTFATQADPYRCFVSKAEGIQELLRQVDCYPKDTRFYFDAWTFGYEDVWQALSHFLASPIHVDNYRYRLYSALATGPEPKATEAAKLMGFYCGNHFQGGCLSREQNRLHCCEAGAGCEIWNQEYVRITPILSRHNGVAIAELGAVGEQGELSQQHELEVDDEATIGQLMALCKSEMKGQTQLLDNVLQLLTAAVDDNVSSIILGGFRLNVDKDKADKTTDSEGLPIEMLLPTLARLAARKEQTQTLATGGTLRKEGFPNNAKRADDLPTQVLFPFSRHSSYEELCYLVAAFKPENIYPCTVDHLNWTPQNSMGFLFGHIYQVLPAFSHDQMMLRKHERRSEEHKKRSAQEVPLTPQSYAKRTISTKSSTSSQPRDLDHISSPLKSRKAEPQDDIHVNELHHTPQIQNESFAQTSAHDENLFALHTAAFNAALRGDGTAWSEIGIVSVDGHQVREEEL